MPQAFYVQSSIQIAINRTMATTTLKNTNVKRHILDVSTLMACFGGRFPLVNLADMFASLICHPVQNLQKLTEGKVADLPPPQLLHCGNAQRFKVHAVEPVTQGVSQLEKPVGSSVSNPFVCLTQSMLCLSAIVAAFLFACQFSVAFGYLSHTSLKELRTFNGGTVTASEECFEAEVKPCRVNGTSGLASDIFLLATKHHPKTIHAVPLERASLDPALDLARLNELVLMLAEAYSIASEISPSALLKHYASISRGLLKLGFPSLQAGSLLDPPEKRLVRQVKSFGDCLHALRADNFPFGGSVSDFCYVLSHGKSIAMFFEKTEVCSVKCYAVIANASGHSNKPMKPVVLTAFIHPEFIADSQSTHPVISALPKRPLTTNASGVPLTVSS